MNYFVLLYSMIIAAVVVDTLFILGYWQFALYVWAACVVTALIWRRWGQKLKRRLPRAYLRSRK